MAGPNSFWINVRVKATSLTIKMDLISSVVAKSKKAQSM